MRWAVCLECCQVSEVTPTTVCRGVKLANTLLALAPGQLPLVKLADFGFSKDVGQHGAPQSQVRAVVKLLVCRFLLNGCRGGAALYAAPAVMHNAHIHTFSSPLHFAAHLAGRHSAVCGARSHAQLQQRTL
jgi:hypothetical protein